MKRRNDTTLLKVLEEQFPSPASELVFSNDYELIVSVVLSAQCTDKKVNEVTPALFQAYPTFAALAEASLEEVEAHVRSINYYRTKAKNLITLSKKVTEDFQGKVPDTYDDLCTLPGVGRKTANVVLTERGVGYAIAVDTHVFRVARRLGLSNGTKPLAVELDLIE